MSVIKGIFAAALLALPMLAGAEEIGQVSTVFKFVGPNDRIVVEAFDDPKVEGVTCYLSRAKTGGVKGGLGFGRRPCRGVDRLPSGGADPLQGRAQGWR